MSTGRCGQYGPIMKGDTGPVICDLPPGHNGNHSAINYDLPWELRLRTSYRRTWPNAASVEPQ